MESSAPAAPRAPASALDPQRWWVLTLLCGAFFMVILDASIVFVVLPSIGADLGFSEQGLQWVVSACALTFGGHLRCLVTRANRQPAVANYVRKPGDEGYTPMALDVVRIVDGAVADIVTFDGSVFPWFGLPEAL